MMTSMARSLHLVEVRPYAEEEEEEEEEDVSFLSRLLFVITRRCIMLRRARL